MRGTDCERGLIDMKKLLAMVIAILVVAMTLSVAFAAQTYTITVKDGYKGETYTAYRIFDVTYSSTSYAYTISADGEWFRDIIGATTADAAGDYTLEDYGIKLQRTAGANTYNVVNAVDGTNPTAEQMARLAERLSKADLTGKTAAGTGTEAKRQGDGYGAKADVTINVTPDVAGYYFVTTTTGALCALNTTDANAEVQEKNDLPDIDKKQQIGEAPTSAAGYVDDQLDVQVGDTVWYQVEVKDGKGTDSAITVVDQMGTGLKYDTASDPVITASIAGAEEAAVANTNYQVTEKTESGFTVTFNADYVKTLTEADKVYIRFAATVTYDATTVDRERNTVTLTYSHQSKEDHVDVTTYMFQLDKTDGEYRDLRGARFELYRGSRADENKVWFMQDHFEDGVLVLYVNGVGATPPVKGTFTEIQLTDPWERDNSLDTSKVIIKGLDRDNYVLHETKAPAGYNALGEDRVVAADELVAIGGIIIDAVGIKNDTGVVTVVNEAGVELPSTGGVGAMNYYMAGGALVLAAAILLATWRRA